MPDYISVGGRWVQKEQIPKAPEPKIEAVKKDIEKVETIVKPITKSKAKKGRPKKAR